MSTLRAAGPRAATVGKRRVAGRPQFVVCFLKFVLESRPLARRERPTSSPPGLGKQRPVTRRSQRAQGRNKPTVGEGQHPCYQGPFHRTFLCAATFACVAAGRHSPPHGGKATPRPGGFQHPVVPPLDASGMTSTSYPGPGPGLMVPYIGMFVPDSDSV